MRNKYGWFLLAGNLTCSVLNAALGDWWTAAFSFVVSIAMVMADRLPQ